jgi:hypothetical protein
MDIISSGNYEPMYLLYLTMVDLFHSGHFVVVPLLLCFSLPRLYAVLSAAHVSAEQYTCCSLVVLAPRDLPGRSRESC